MAALAHRSARPPRTDRLAPHLLLGEGGEYDTWERLHHARREGDGSWTVQTIHDSGGIQWDVGGWNRGALALSTDGTVHVAVIHQATGQELPIGVVLLTGTGGSWTAESVMPVPYSGARYLGFVALHVDPESGGLHLTAALGYEETLWRLFRP